MSLQHINENFSQISGEVISAIYEMSKGSNMLMAEKTKRPHFRKFILSKDLKYLQWHTPKNSREDSFVLVAQITEVLEGQRTDNFENCQIPEDFKVLAFSVVYSSEQGPKSLNIVSKDKKEYHVWLTGLRALISGVQDREFLEEMINSDEDVDKGVQTNATLLERHDKKESLKETWIGANGNRGSNRSSVGTTHRTAGSSDMYTWGDGSRSMLGHGEEIEEHRPRIVDALSTLHIKLVSCGAYHTLCVTASGETLSWGAGSKGQLGQGHLRDRFTPLRVEGLQHEVVVQISCNEYHSAAVTDKGKLYTWGYGSIKLGYEAPNEKQLTPKVVESLAAYTLIHASCGKDFTLACSSDGQVFAFGNNKFYQLGLGDNNPRYEPTLLEFENIDEDHITQVSCGQYHSAAISDGGNVWMWGINEYGQLGTDDNFTMISKPCKLLISKENGLEVFVMDVSCGNRYTAVVTFCGLVYCFGDHSDNQLEKKNFVDDSLKCNRLQKTKFPSGVKIKKVSCGAYHTAALSECGEIFTWGNGSDKKLGHGDDNLRSQPTQITECFEGKRVTSVSCGLSHSACTAEILPRGSGVKNCMGCHGKFSNVKLIKSRYHCDGCGGTFCSSCVPKRPYRLCDKCFKILEVEVSI